VKAGRFGDAVFATRFTLAAGFGGFDSTGAGAAMVTVEGGAAVFGFPAVFAARFAMTFGLLLVVVFLAIIFNVQRWNLETMPWGNERRLAAQAKNFGKNKSLPIGSKRRNPSRGNPGL
jgi:hypothetical protein